MAFLAFRCTIAAHSAEVLSIGVRALVEQGGHSVMIVPAYSLGSITRNNGQVKIKIIVSDIL